MTEEKDIKKPTPAKRFLKGFFLCAKWLFVLILTAILAGGIYFQAPLKILILLAVFLIALTILPKPLRKYFWLTVTCVIVALTVWVFLPDDDSGEWKPYTFDDELAALEAKRDIPDDQNAAIIYNRLLAEYDPNSFYPDFWNDELEKLTYSQYFSSRDHPELAKWIKNQQYIIDKLVLASMKDDCQFQIRYDTAGLTKQLERLTPIKRWAQLLVRAGNNDIGDGRIDEALAKYIVVIKMSKHVYQQEPLIEQLVAMAIESLGNSQIIRFVVTGDATDERLSLLEEASRDFGYEWETVWPRVLDSEKLFTKEAILSCHYQINPEGKIRFSHDPRAKIREAFPKDKWPKENWLQKKLYRLSQIDSWLTMPPLQEASKIIDDGYHDFYAMAKPDYIWKENTIDIFNAMPDLIPSRYMSNFKTSMAKLLEATESLFHVFHDSYLGVSSKRKSSHIIIALKRFKNKNGHWPESLDEIKDTSPEQLFIDPINKGSYVYKLMDEDFELYSKGKNGIDEEGIKNIDFDPNGLNWFEIKEDDIMFWPKRDRKCE